MDIKTIKGSFCCNERFRNNVIDIITHLLSPNGISFDKTFRRPGYFYPDNLKDWYEEMEKYVDDDPRQYQSKEGYIKGELNKNICIDSLLKDGDNIVAGLDTPVWIGNPEANTRIMIVSQDPRRSNDEMAGHTPCIALSSPFGWHDKVWRSNGKTGLLPQICWEIIQELKKENDKDVRCFYFTDLYKFRKANTSPAGRKDNSKVDKENKGVYFNIIKKEIENFNPTHIVLMGSDVFKTNLFTHLVGRNWLSQVGSEEYNSGKHLFKKIQGTSGIVVAPILHIAYYGKILSNIMKKGNCSKKDCFKNFLKGLV